MTASDALTPEQRGRIVDYLDGELDEAARIEFEMELSENPILAEAFESFARVDALRRLPRDANRSRSFGDPPTPLNALHLLLVAAAAVLLVSAALLLRRGAGDAFDVALLPTARDAAEHNRLIGLDAADLPLDLVDRSRGGTTNDADRPSAGDYWERAEPAQDARARRAIDGGSSTIAAEFFVVPVRPRVDASAVVLLVDAAGDVVDEAPAFPPSRDPLGFDIAWTSESGRLEGAKTSVLPRESLRRDANAEKLSYDAGFVVPRRAGELQVLVALRAEPLGPEIQRSMLDEIAAIDTSATPSRTSTETVERLTEWLAEHGFRTMTLRVVEP